MAEASGNKRPLEGKQVSAKKQKISKEKLSDEFFGIFLVGECGDGKTSLTQYMTDVDTRNSDALLADDKMEGVTKNVSYVNVRPEVMKNAVIIDIPGIGDSDVPIPDLISGIVQQMEAGCPIHAIVLMTSMPKGRCGMGAQAAADFVQQGFVKSMNNIIFCGSQRDVEVARKVDKDDFDLTTKEGKEAYEQRVDKCVQLWRKNVADPVTKKWFRDKHAATVTIQLKMKEVEEGKSARVVDPDSKGTDVSELIGLLRNLQRNKIKKATWETPDLRALYESVSKTFGQSPPSDDAIKKLEEKIEQGREMIEQNKKQHEAMLAQLRENAVRERESIRESNSKIVSALQQQAARAAERAEEATQRAIMLANRPPQVIRVPNPLCPIQ